MTFELKSECLWPTSTISLHLKDAKGLNHSLETIIIEQEQRLTSTGKSTPVAGLESGLTTHWLEYNVLNWDNSAIRMFRSYVLEGVQEFCKYVGRPSEKIAGISCWANVLRRGQALQVHHHDPAFVSAHYTVKAGYEQGDDFEKDGSFDSGHTVYFRPGFLDRSHGGEAATMPSPWDRDWRISVRPTEGRLFFFPSYV